MGMGGGYSNPLHNESLAASVLARATYHPMVAGIVMETLKFMGSHQWAGEQAKLRELIDAIKDDAKRLGGLA